MIILNILTNKEETLTAIIDLILQNKYAQNVQLDHEKRYFKDENGLTKIIETPKLSFVTKALLFNEIEQALYKSFNKTDLTIYSLPLGQMNQEYGNQLRNSLKAV